MAILPPAQLLEGKAGAPGAGQAPEAFPHHSHLALAMTLRGQGQYQRQNAVLRNRPGICFPRGPKGMEIRDLKTGSPGTVWLCSSQCVLNSSWRPLTRHPSTPTPASGGRENTCFTSATLSPFLRGFPDQVWFLWPVSWLPQQIPQFPGSAEAGLGVTDVRGGSQPPSSGKSI